MLTLFAIPKPFIGHIGLIQRNAIESWMCLRPHCEIILLGNDEGTAEVADEFKVIYIPAVVRNEYGTPLIKDMFDQAEKAAGDSLMCYVNADIILMPDFISAVRRVLQEKPRCLMVGQRWDVSLDEAIDFTQNWEGKLKKTVAEKRKLHSPTGIDYFVFNKGIFGDIPPLAIGRTAWDGWLIYRAMTKGEPIVDLTEAVTVVHQNHEYGHPGGKMGVWKSEEARKNLALSGGYINQRTVCNAQYKLKDGKLRRNFPMVQRVYYWAYRYALILRYGNNGRAVWRRDQGMDEDQRDINDG